MNFYTFGYIASVGFLADAATKTVGSNNAGAIIAVFIAVIAALGAILAAIIKSWSENKTSKVDSQKNELLDKLITMQQERIDELETLIIEKKANE